MGNVSAGVSEEKDARVGEHPVFCSTGATEVAIAVLICDRLSPGLLDRLKEPADIGRIRLCKSDYRSSIPGDDPEFCREHEYLLDGEGPDACTYPDVDDTANGTERGAFLYLNDEKVPAVDGRLPGGDLWRRDDRREGARNHLNCCFYVSSDDLAVVIDANDDITALSVGKCSDLAVECP